jgi:6-phosphogluconate dehydrogenase
MLMREAARVYGWNLNYGGIALMWRGGCIIRSRFLGNIKDAFDKNPKLSNLLMDKFFMDAVHSCQSSWRQVVAQGALLGVPTPAFSTALAFYDGYRSERLPANLIQVRKLTKISHRLKKLLEVEKNKSSGLAKKLFMF